MACDVRDPQPLLLAARHRHQEPREDQETSFLERRIAILSPLSQLVSL